MAQSSFQKLVNKLVPTQEFAGLEIGDKAIRFLLLSHYDLSAVYAVEVSLAPGIIEKGELKKQADFIAALESLKIKIAAHDKRLIPCIVTAPSPLFFFQIMELPEVTDISYDEAIRLNATQSSPIQLSNSYLDWQNLGVNLKTLQREFLVGVVARGRVDTYLEAFRRAGFEVIALESRSLSILRLFSYFSKTIEKNITALFIDVGQDGIGFVIGKQGKLYFDFFLYWGEIPEAADGSITREDLEAILKREVLRMVEFANLHHDEGISHFVMFSPVLKPELEKFVQNQFSLRPIELMLPSVGIALTDLWAGATGAGLRGSLIPRESDDLISLLPEGTETLYQAKRLESFISLWAKIISVTLIGLVMVFGSMWGIALQQQKSSQATLASLNSLPEVLQVKGLQDEAEVFNRQLARLEKVDRKTVDWSGFLEPIVNAAVVHRISIERLSFGEANREIAVQGVAPTQEDALGFSKAFDQNKDFFLKVSMPLSSLSPVPGGVAFSMTITMVPLPTGQ